MLLNIRHTGLVVRNASASIKFYEGLGFVVEKQMIETGDFISHVVGIPEVRIETIKMRAQDGSMIELLQYHSHQDNSVFTKQPSNQHGCSHLAMTVSSIEDFCQKITMLGGSIVSLPMRSADGKVSVAYCHDNDGILLEIVQEIGGD